MKKLLVVMLLATYPAYAGEVWDNGGPDPTPPYSNQPQMNAQAQYQQDQVQAQINAQAVQIQQQQQEIDSMQREAPATLNGYVGQR